MRTFAIKLIIALLTFSCGLGLTQLISPSHPTLKIATENPALLHELIEAEAIWQQALLNDDAVLLDRILADDFVNIDPYGDTDAKAAYSRLVIEPQRYRLSAVSFDEPRLLIAERQNEARLEIGKTLVIRNWGTLHLRDVDTLRKENGRWRFVGSDSTQNPFTFNGKD